MNDKMKLGILAAIVASAAGFSLYKKIKNTNKRLVVKGEPVLTKTLIAKGIGTDTSDGDKIEIECSIEGFKSFEVKVANNLKKTLIIDWEKSHYLKDGLSSGRLYPMRDVGFNKKLSELKINKCIVIPGSTTVDSMIPLRNVSQQDFAGYNYNGIILEASSKLISYQLGKGKHSLVFPICIENDDLTLRKVGECSFEFEIDIEEVVES